MAKERKPKKPPPDTADSKAAKGFLEGSGEKPENWADQPDSEAYIEAKRLYPLIQKSYDNRQEASDNIEEFWKIYNAQPDANLQYVGNSQCYVPVVRDAINARAKRSLKQLFPSKYRHVEAVGSDSEMPWPQLALLEHYIRKTRLKTIIRSMLVAGDVTGQWNLYVDWTRSYRRVTELVKRNPVLEEGELEDVSRSAIAGEGGASSSALELFDPTVEEEATETEDVLTEGPEVVDFATDDLAVVPPTVDHIEKAEVTAIRLRCSKDKIEQMVDEGVFVIPEEGDIKEFMAGHVGEDSGRGKRNSAKQRTNEAGIRTEGTLKYAMIYEGHAKLPFPDTENPGKTVKMLAYIYYASKDEILGIIKAPQWNGKRPIISAPVERVQGSFWGQSRVEPVKFMQWNLVDLWNLGQDSALYSLLPIVMTDPAKQPNYASMVIGLAAVWAADPNSTKFASFPQLYKDAYANCDVIKRQIWESMDVNEMMMGKMPQGRKNNQLMGQMQQDQMTNIIDHSERCEEEVLNPLMEFFMEYDAQFRTKALTVVTKGEIGVKAAMQAIEPQQWGERYAFTWSGTDQVQGMQRMQQQIAGMNMLRGIPPEQLGGKRIDVSPIIEKFVENLWGPEVAPRILVDDRNLFTIPPEIENEMMLNGLPVDVHEADDDIKHIQEHQQGAQSTKDQGGRVRAHIAKHMMQMQAKRQKAQGQAKGQPGAPGGAGPGMPGTPRPGAQPQGPKGPQGPPGMIHPDQAGGRG